MASLFKLFRIFCNFMSRMEFHCFSLEEHVNNDFFVFSFFFVSFLNILGNVYSELPLMYWALRFSDNFNGFFYNVDRVEDVLYFFSQLQFFLMDLRICDAAIISSSIYYHISFLKQLIE